MSSASEWTEYIIEQIRILNGKTGTTERPF